MRKLQQLYHIPHVHKLNAKAVWCKAKITRWFTGNCTEIYGSSRLGIYKIDSTLWNNGITPTISNVYTQKLGLKRYELSNHLGNVQTVVTDRKLVDSHSGGQITAWKADVISVADYYPFGMKIEERSWNTTNYRYNFNGKDFFADWNRQDYGFRIYDPRKCRFESVDPLSDKFAWNSTYCFAENDVMRSIDLDGVEKVYVSLFQLGKVGLPDISVTQWYEIGGQIESASFNKAAKYNTENLNSGAYQTISDRNAWYQWADKQVGNTGNPWFKAAVDVTGTRGVGAAENINLGFITEQEEFIMVTTNKGLLEANFKNFGNYVLGKGPVTFDGFEYDSSDPMKLAEEMVNIEQTEVQRLLDGPVRSAFNEKFGSENWNKAISGINQALRGESFGTGNILGKAAASIFNGNEPGSIGFARESFKKDFPGIQYDFSKKEHRVYTGVKMAEFIQKQRNDANKNQ